MPALDITRIGPADAADLGTLFEALAADSEAARFFHPHPLTRTYAAELCARTDTSRDRYYIARRGGRAVGYALLRGWDEGYAVPSFGVAVHPEARGLGVGQALLGQAVAASRASGAPALRLTVYKANARAVHVYRKAGFVYRDKNEHEWVGVLDLAPLAA